MIDFCMLRAVHCTNNDSLKRNNNNNINIISSATIDKSHKLHGQRVNVIVL